MSAADVARRDAVRALEARLHGWGVENPLTMAQRFIDDLTRQGWVWAPMDRRPTPPRPDEACMRCGRHLPCGCDSPTQRPDAPAEPTDFYRAVRAQIAANLTITPPDPRGAQPRDAVSHLSDRPNEGAEQ